jgi:SAM-dependent methyltransferase
MHEEGCPLTELITRPARTAVAGPVETAPGALLADWFGAATAPDAALQPRLMRFADGRIQPLPVHRWAGPVTAADESMLARAHGPVLDVGCGPGRLTAALHERGTEVLGLDLDAQIPVLAAAAGAPVLLASVWDELPRPGGWGTVLLADGNVGIGGEPARLLRRLRTLLRPGGSVLVELQPSAEPPVPGNHARVRLEELGRHSSWFSWGLLGGAALPAVASAAGLRVGERWSAERREFAA